MESKKQERTCRQCGSIFRQHKGTQVDKYCSRKCYHESRKIRKDKVCRRCSKKFYPSRSLEQLYCSRKCYFADKKEFHTVPKTCIRCGKSFAVLHMRREHSQNHCQKCIGELTAYKIILCKRCGKKIRVRQQTIEKGAAPIYCSETCYRPPRYTKCKTCGKTFRSSPTLTKKKMIRFCSRRCYYCYRGPSSSEERMIKTLKTLDIQYIREYRVEGSLYKLDFFFPTKNLAFEIDGEYWHKDTKEHDRQKDLYSLSQGIDTIRISDRKFMAMKNPDRFVLDVLQKHTGSQGSRRKIRPVNK